MTPRPDDDALSWDGDDDPTLDVGAGVGGATEAPVDASRPGSAALSGASAPLPGGPAALPDGPVALPEGFEAVGRGSETVAHVADVQEPAQLGNAMLVTLGLFGGVYLLYAIGWVVGGLRLQGQLAYLVSDVMFQGSFWLAVLAPVLWFATVFLLTTRSAAWVRIVWLVAGGILLVPWPFILTGAVGR